jgi:hypothetical protein
MAFHKNATPLLSFGVDLLCKPPPLRLRVCVNLHGTEEKVICKCDLKSKFVAELLTIVKYSVIVDVSKIVDRFSGGGRCP